MEVVLTASTQLAKSTSYLDASSAALVSAEIKVVGPGGVLADFTLPVSALQIHTDGTASAVVAGIDSWVIYGEHLKSGGDTPDVLSTNAQAYSINTVAFVPGADIQGATGLAAGNTDYDVAMETCNYAQNSGIDYFGLINPANSSGASWSVRYVPDVTTPPPPAATLSISGVPGDGQVGHDYKGTLKVSGGKAPYKWTATGLPKGLRG